MNAAGVIYAAGDFKKGNDTNNGLFYKTAKFQFISNDSISTALRTINQFKLVYLATGDTIRIFSVHLKASSGNANDSLRMAEVDSLRKVTDTFAAGTSFVVCGDFNIYGSTDLAYQHLLAVHAGKSGHFFDPVTMNGTWNNSTYAQYHTQSTRLRTFGGGSTGGMDDRFDLILYSGGINTGTKISYVANSYRPVGNDGQHFNDSINAPPYNVVSQNVANALHANSDHLPVVALFNVNATISNIDAGILSIISPVITPCNNTNRTLKSVLKNFGASAINFSSTNVTVNISATNPSNIVTNFSQTINSGTLTAGATMDIVFSTTYDMSAVGNYVFNSSSVSANDNNAANNSATPLTVVVNSGSTATITPSGTIGICQGNPKLLNASGGSSFLWSNGFTTQTVSVTDSGLYTVTITDNNGCTSTSTSVHIVYNVPVIGGTIFHENMGTTTTTTLIPAYETANGFESVALTMSGSADVRSTLPSSGYAGASGVTNLFITNAVGKNLIISGINTVGKSGLTCSFGLYKSSTALSSHDLKLKYSVDGVNYDTLSIPPLPIGTGTSKWYYVSAIGTIPQAANLRLQFVQAGTAVMFRIDDIQLTYQNIPLISASGPTTFCAGDSVTLTTNTGTNYLWSTGATTQSINVKTSGAYSVSVDCVNSPSQTVTVNSCGIYTVNVHLFIQGYYIGNNEMNPVLYNTGVSSDPTACDYIKVNLYDADHNNAFFGSGIGLLHTDGTASIPFTYGNLIGKNCFIEIVHRNSIATWCKTPYLLTGNSVFMDLSY